MKLHELSPAEGSVKEGFRKGRGAYFHSLFPIVISPPIKKATCLLQQIA